MSVDNPYYFQNPSEQANTLDSPAGRTKGGFSFFKRRSNVTGSKCLATPKKKFDYSIDVGAGTVSSISPTATLGHHRCSSFKTILRPHHLEPTSSNGDQRQHCQGHQHQHGGVERKHHDMFYDRISQSFDRSKSFRESIPADNMQCEMLRCADSIGSDQYSCSNSNGSIDSGMRRHSIGTFIRKERLRCGSFSDEVPKMVAPKPPPIVVRTREKGDLKANTNMDDIVIITSRLSEPALLWANYLKTRFDKITRQRGKKPFNFLHVKIDDALIPADIAQRCRQTKLQIVIVCPSLLTVPGRILKTQLADILRSEKVLGILLDVDEEVVMENHMSSLPSFRLWHRCVVRNHQDQSFLGNVLGVATDILGRALRDQPSCSTALISSPVTPVAPNHHRAAGTNESFTILPRKVKIGQNKVVALLNESLTKDDMVRVYIERTGETVEVTNIKRRNPYTLQFTIPEACMEISMMIEIRLDKNGADIGSRPVKCESRLREMEQILRSQDSPIEFLCQSMGIVSSDRDKLDTLLLQSFQKNMPPNFHLLSTPADKQQHIMMQRESSPEEYPTLLHFAAHYGLERLAMQLLECPGGDSACAVRNFIGKTPAEIAEGSEFPKLAETLKNFSQVHEFSTMYHYFKGISESASAKVVVEPKMEPKTTQNGRSKSKNSTPHGTDQYMEMTGSCSSSSGSDRESITLPNAVTNLNYINVDVEENAELFTCDVEALSLSEPSKAITSNEMSFNEPDYFDSNDVNRQDPDDFSQECSNLLETCNRSINSASIDCCDGNYLIQPSNRPVEVEKLADNNLFGDYLIQPSNIPVLESVRPLKKSDVPDESSHLKFNFRKRDNSDGKSQRTGTLKRQGSDTSKTSVDDELLEIINDFKNNVFTIQEVEQLVAAWKNRNDVKQSFKDKQDQLKRMRDEYERIQHEMKEKMKRATPFDRVRKLFSRNRSHHSVADKTKKPDEEIIVDQLAKAPLVFQSQHRPMSSLSLQSVSSSSSSSGRMSTCSGASLGDSGTHSDHEDRRQMIRVGMAGSLIDNYNVPPVPRPLIHTPTSTPVEEKDCVFFPANEHYVFFPSNMPVHDDFVNGHGLRTIEEAKETPPEIVPPVVVQPIKIIQRSEIIYGPSPDSRVDLCSSFKPISPMTPATVADNSSTGNAWFDNHRRNDKIKELRANIDTTPADTKPSDASKAIIDECNNNNNHNKNSKTNSCNNGMSRQSSGDDNNPTPSRCDNPSNNQNSQTLDIASSSSGSSSNISQNIKNGNLLHHDYMNVDLN